MSTEENVALAHRYFDAANHVFATGEVSALDPFFAPGYIEHVRVTGPDLGLQGLKDFLLVIREAFPDARATVEDVVATGDRLVIRHGHRGTQTGAFLGMPPSGKSIDFQGIEIARIADGKIVESWHVDDTLTMMQQLGAVPPPGPPMP